MNTQPGVAPGQAQLELQRSYDALNSAHAAYQEAIRAADKAWVGDDVDAYRHCREAERTAREAFWAADRAYLVAARATQMAPPSGG